MDIDALEKDFEDRGPLAIQELREYDILAYFELILNLMEKEL